MSYSYKSLFAALSACIVFIVGGAQAASDHHGDLQYWQTLGLRFHDGDSWRVKGTMQSRLFDHANYLGTYLVMPSLEYKLSSDWVVGGSYLYEGCRSDSGLDYTQLHILWLYLSSDWQVVDDVKFSMRHVAAYRSVESGHDYWVSRHKFGFSYNLKQFQYLKGLSTNTELFYNYDSGRICENRFVPLSILFRLNSGMSLSLYLMIQSKDFSANNDWEHASVVGQSLSLDF